MIKRIESKDIYAIEIADIGISNSNDYGYYDLEAEVDDVIQDDDIKIKISGDGLRTGNHYDKPYAFKGTLTMNESDFMQACTYASEVGRLYITFDGSIELLLANAEQEVKVDDCNIEDTFYDTMHNILDKLDENLLDYGVFKEVVLSVIINSVDKVAEEIKRIDNVNINKDNKNEYEDYVFRNIINESGLLVDNKYKSIDKILNAQATKDIKNGKISEVINNELNDTVDRVPDKRKITAKVFFSFLDS